MCGVNNTNNIDHRSVFFIMMIFDMEVSDIITSKGMKQITARAWWLNKRYRWFKKLLATDQWIGKKWYLKVYINNNKIKMTKEETTATWQSWLLDAIHKIRYQKQRPNVERISACILMHHPQYSNEAVQEHIEMCVANKTITKVS